MVIPAPSLFVSQTTPVVDFKTFYDILLHKLLDRIIAIERNM